MSLSSIHPPLAWPIAVLALLLSASAAMAQDPDAEASVRWGPLSMRSKIALSNLGIDTNVFNSGPATQLPQDFTLTFTPTTDLWLRLGRTWVDGTIVVDWVYFQKYASERGANSQYRVGVSRTINRLRVVTGASRLSARDRPNREIDLRSQRFVRTFNAELEFRAFGRTSVGAKTSHQKATFDKDAFFLGRSLAVELDHTTAASSAFVRHSLTPLTTITIEGGTEKERFFTSQRDADSTRLMSTVALQPSALVNGQATVGYRHFVPHNPTSRPFSGLTTAVNLSYRLFGSAKLIAQLDRDVVHAFDPLQPYYVVTAQTWTIQQQIYGPFDAMARINMASLAYRDRIGAVVQVSNRVDHGRTIGAGTGYRLGLDKRVGFTLDYVTRASSLPGREYKGLRYGFSITYER